MMANSWIALAAVRPSWVAWSIGFTWEWALGNNRSSKMSFNSC